MKITFVDVPPHLCGELGECCIRVEGSKVTVELDDFENELSYEVQKELLKYTEDFIVITNVDEETFEQFISCTIVLGNKEKCVIPADCMLNEYVDELLSHVDFVMV